MTNMSYIWITLSEDSDGIDLQLLILPRSRTVSEETA